MTCRLIHRKYTEGAVGFFQRCKDNNLFFLCIQDSESSLPLERNTGNKCKMSCCPPSFTWHIVPYQTKAGAKGLYNKTKLYVHQITEQWSLLSFTHLQNFPSNHFNCSLVSGTKTLDSFSFVHFSCVNFFKMSMFSSTTGFKCLISLAGPPAVYLTNFVSSLTVKNADHPLIQIPWWSLGQPVHV